MAGAVKSVTIGGERLTEMQATFIRGVALGMPFTEAAERAGYADAGRVGSHLAQLPAIRRALFEARQAKLQGEIATVALLTLEALMQPGNPAGVRFQAASYVLDRAGHAPKSADGAKSLDEKDLNEMTEAELMEVISKARDSLDKAKASTIEGESAEVSAEDAPLPALPAPQEPQDPAAPDDEVHNLG